MSIPAGNRPGFLDEPPVVSAAPTVHAPPEHPLRPALLDPDPDGPVTLRSAWEPRVLATASTRTGNGFWVAVGLLIAVGSWAAFTALSWFVEVLTNPGPLGILGALGVGAGLVLAGWGLVREWGDFRRLRSVDRTRAILSDPDLPVARVRAEALAWVDRVADRIADAAAVRGALHEATSTEEIRAILMARVADPLAAVVRRIGQDAAIEVAALVAISPHASWDGLIAAWKGVRVIRRVACVYGLRPGSMATASLVRKVAWTAAGTSGVDLLSQTLADQALSSLPIARHLIAAVPGGGVAALRLYRLASITARACCPVRE